MIDHYKDDVIKAMAEAVKQQEALVTHEELRLKEMRRVLEEMES